MTRGYPGRPPKTQARDAYVPSDFVAEVAALDKALYRWLVEHRAAWAGWPKTEALGDPLALSERRARLCAIGCPSWRVLGVEAVDHHIAILRVGHRALYEKSVEGTV